MVVMVDVNRSIAFDPHAPRQYGVCCFLVRMLKGFQENFIYVMKCHIQSIITPIIDLFQGTIIP